MKKLSFFNLLFIFISLTLFADDKILLQNQFNNKSSLSEINNPEGLDDSDLFRKNERVVFVNGEFLYWIASCGNKQYAFQYDRAVAGQINYGLGKYVFSKYDWDPGFRVAIGWFNAPKTYQVIGQFTWIKINNTNQINRSAPFDQPFVAAFPQYDTLNGQELSSAKSKIKLNHELGDLIISRVWVPNLHCRLRLLGGLTGGEIQQKWSIFYTNVISEVEKVYNRWKFTGIGIRLGLDMDWFWTRHFYLTGKASCAPFIGKYKYLGQISVDSTQYADFKYDQHRGAYNFQIYLGPSYQRSFTNNRFEIFAGYELNGWYNVHEVIINSLVSNGTYLSKEIVPIINKGLFLMHGLTARLNIDF